MIDADKVAEGFERALAHGERLEDPFPVIRFEPFGPELYAAMLRNLPGDEHYTYLMHRDAARPDGTSTRRLLSLNEDGLRSLPPEQRLFWTELGAALRSPLVRGAFLRHLQPELEARFGKRLADIPCHPAPRLVRDSDGYRITPHPDGSWMTFTAQVYLPPDDNESAVGTSFYRQTEKQSFELVHTVPFRPNTGYCFAVTDRSWHGVEPIKVVRPRDSLMLTCFQIPPPF